MILESVTENQSHSFQAQTFSMQLMHALSRQYELVSHCCEPIRPLSWFRTGERCRRAREHSSSPGISLAAHPRAPREGNVYPTDA